MSVNFPMWNLPRPLFAISGRLTSGSARNWWKGVTPSMCSCALTPQYLTCLTTSRSQTDKLAFDVGLREHATGKLPFPVSVWWGLMLRIFERDAEHVTHLELYISKVKNIKLIYKPSEAESREDVWSMKTWVLRQGRCDVGSLRAETALMDCYCK